MPAHIPELRKAELFAVEEVGIERMKQLNENMALFVELFSKAGGRKSNETNSAATADYFCWAVVKGKMTS